MGDNAGGDDVDWFSCLIRLATEHVIEDVVDVVPTVPLGDDDSFADDTLAGEEAGEEAGEGEAAAAAASEAEAAMFLDPRIRPINV